MLQGRQAVGGQEQGEKGEGAGATPAGLPRRPRLVTLPPLIIIAITTLQPTRCIITPPTATTATASALPGPRLQNQLQCGQPGEAWVPSTMIIISSSSPAPYLPR